jgi:hypothetical protein
MMHMDPAKPKTSYIYSENQNRRKIIFIKPIAFELFLFESFESNFFLVNVNS